MAASDSERVEVVVKHRSGPVPSAEGDAHAVQRVAKQAPAAERSTVRVDTAKIDKLIDLIGELVIAQSMVTAALDDCGPAGAGARLREAVLAVDRNTRELQDRVMAVRMLPIGSVFNRFPRMVRDLSTSLGKRVNLVIGGEEVELDKGMVEKLADPLTHLVRNAIDHGIETAEERREAGKPEEGTLHIVAVHQGGSVVIEVSDDGRGLALDRIRDKALKLGLLPSGVEPTIEDLHQVIFAPGFSTKDQVSDLSGRGVGMDVVKRNVEALGGAIAFSSEVGKGSRMRIRLPLTMAIIDGLTLRIGEQVFVLPLVEVVESLRPTSSQYQTVLGHGEVVRVRDQAVPLVRLHDVLSVKDAETDPLRALVCIVETRTTPVGLLVDEILGQAQVVVKTLETNYHRIEGVMGATILGDGRVALILDVQAVARRAAASGSSERESLYGAAGRAA
jgi:two-component system chemotaxis sensor kinase CheA